MNELWQIFFKEDIFARVLTHDILLKEQSSQTLITEGFVGCFLTLS